MKEGGKQNASEKDDALRLRRCNVTGALVEGSSEGNVKTQDVRLSAGGLHRFQCDPVSFTTR